MVPLDVYDDSHVKPHKSDVDSGALNAKPFSGMLVSIERAQKRVQMRTVTKILIEAD